MYKKIFRNLPFYQNPLKNFITEICNFVPITLSYNGNDLSVKTLESLFQDILRLLCKSKSNSFFSKLRLS